MPHRLLQNYRARLASGALKPDAIQAEAAEKLADLAVALKRETPSLLRFLRRAADAPRGLYLWGDVGRGKSMLMDLFFAVAPVKARRRVHFNAFMAEVHAAIFAARQRGEGDEIAAVAKGIADRAHLLCFDEFQVTDVADAMILGRLFQHLFDLGVVVVATSNTPPSRLYEGGLNRQLFLPFIAMIAQRMAVFELNGHEDYRRDLGEGGAVYITPLGAEADAAMDRDWNALAHGAAGAPSALQVLGRTLPVLRAADGVARFDFADLCEKPLAAADYLAVAKAFHTVLLDRVPRMGRERRDAARRFVLLIDTLYDERVRLECSAAAAPDALYFEGDGAETFRRTASRLIEMQGADYWRNAKAASSGAAPSS